MANAPAGDKPKNQAPEAETLKPRDEAETRTETKPKDTSVTHNPISEAERKHRLLAYRPGHKAMFIGLGVVVVILGVNAGVLAFLLKSESANSKAIDSKGVSISPGTLSKLGVNDSQIGSSNEKLTVDPAAQFNSQLTVGGNVSIGGQLHLNSTLNATSANFTQLQAATAQANTININGAATASTLSVRSNSAFAGAAQFQNTVTIAGLLSVDSSAAVASNLSVGQDLSAATVAAGTLVVSGETEFGGHVLTAGGSPGVSELSGASTASLSGNDEAGTVFIGVGASGGNGPVAHVSFRSDYSASPVVVISPLGNYGDFYVENVSTSGFDIAAANTLGAGGYQINYIVEQ